MPEINSEKNQVLDTVLRERRSIRSFKPDLPPREAVEAVIEAGLQAPYAALAVSGNDYRRFKVIPRDSRTMAAADEIVKRRLALLAEQFNKEMQEKPSLRPKGENYARALGMAAANGLTGPGAAPCLIVVTERKGVPPVEQQSLAHVLQNMWLKATALGLGFRLISLIGGLSGDQDFCALLGLPPGEFELNCCGVGYAAAPPPPIERPRLADVVTWLD